MYSLSGASSTRIHILPETGAFLRVFRSSLAGVFRFALVCGVRGHVAAKHRHAEPDHSCLSIVALIRGTWLPRIGQLATTGLCAI